MPNGTDKLDPVLAFYMRLMRRQRALRRLGYMLIFFAGAGLGACVSLI